VLKRDEVPLKKILPPSLEGRGSGGWVIKYPREAKMAKGINRVEGG
jgi:hypothetical protein